jgi:transposase-like protein
MGQKSGPGKKPAEQVVKEIRRATRRQFSAEEKIRIVLTGLRGEDSIAELCRREGIVQNLYYRWSKEFLEAGKKRLAALCNSASCWSRSVPVIALGSDVAEGRS